MVVALAATAVLVAAPSGLTGQQPNLPKIGALSWMTGCWRANGGVEEFWTDATGGQLFGINRSIEGDRVHRWEFLRIYEGREGLIYSAAPSHQPPAEFTAVVATPDSVAFLNPQHDFPTRITYQPALGDSLWVTVSGPGDDGNSVGFQLRMGRFSCGEGAWSG